MTASATTRGTFAEFGERMERVSDAYQAHGISPTMIVLEQRTIRSSRLRECIDCGDPGTIEQVSGLIKVVRSYWFCADCAGCWQAR